jgi:prevent-host-death family protein
MTTVGASEAKTHLAQLLDRVEHGESITVTKRGRAVARLVPVDRPTGDVDGWSPASGMPAAGRGAGPTPCGT